MRFLLSIVAGFFLWSALWLTAGLVATTALPDLYNNAGFSNDRRVLIGFLVFSVVISVLSGRCAAAIAKEGRKACVPILAALLLLAGLWVQIDVWDSMPLWYHVPFLALLYPATVWGGR